MGTFAEDCAEAYQFTREAQDTYALTSLERFGTAADLLYRIVDPRAR